MTQTSKLLKKELAALLLSPEVQVSFNLKKGSLPVRGDVDLSAANDCMQKGLEILASGAILPSGDQTLSPDTSGQIEDLMVEFWNDPSYLCGRRSRAFRSNHCRR